MAALVSRVLPSSSEPFCQPSTGLSVVGRPTPVSGRSREFHQKHFTYMMTSMRHPCLFFSPES